MGVPLPFVEEAMCYINKCKKLKKKTLFQWLNHINNKLLSPIISPETQIESLKLSL